MPLIKTLEDLNKIRTKNEENVLERKIGSKQNKRYVLVCGGTGCTSSGCREVMNAFQDETAKKPSANIEIVRTGCNGICALGPLAVIYPEGTLYTRLKPENVQSIVESHLFQGKIVEEFVYKDANTNEPAFSMEEIPFFQKQHRFARKYTGIIDPEKIEEYIAVGGYVALAKVLTSMKPEEVIQTVRESGLRGRGGGGFPTALKWEIAAKQKSETGEKYIVCNADEGDPGAFMDRSQLEGDPHSVLEGMAIAGYAIGANKGYIYCRAEYPLAIDRIDIALDQAREFGIFGKDIFNSGFDFDIEVRMGAGAFVCGEETAMINSIEGNRGEPKPKPPFPAERGVWGGSTIVNNVETYGNVPPIINLGASAFNSMGTEKSKGTKIFALAGAIKNVGLIEVPMGITLGEIIYDIGGGILNDKDFKAAQIGGPSGGCLPKKLLNVPIDYESLKKVGAMMGSGGLIVMSEDTCMVDLAKFFMEFIQDESCGKCPPCRIGTKQMYEILDRISKGNGQKGDIENLIQLGEDIKASAICGLGQTAPNPILSTIANFREEYEEHINEKRCPAGVCAELVYAPCQNACPAGVNVPAFVSLTSVGRYADALAQHLDRNPFPMACGLTCTHPCETKCRRSTLDAPLSIREIKRFMAEKGGKQGSYAMPAVMKRPEKEVKKIAVIGGGPAGLTAAYFLRRLGHGVTIYEGQEKLGGMMRYGIPEYRYPKAILDHEIENILKMGVRAECSKMIGKDIQMDELKKQNDAVIIAVGGWSSRKLNIPNEDANGVIPGRDFLWKVAYGDIRKLKGKIVVIGGGNTAIDVARTSLRLGASEVTLAYRRSINQMPAELEEIHELIDEGIHPFELHDIEAILSENGKLTGVRLRKQRLGEFDLSGRKKSVPLPGEDASVTLECDYLIPSISQSIDLSFAGGLQTQKDGKIKVNPTTFQTSDPQIFAAGDVVDIANLAIAIGQGEKVAVSIEKVLNPKIIREFSWRKPVSSDVFFDSNMEPVEKVRVETKYVPVNKRIHNFSLVNQGVDREEKMKEEAKRCLRCDYREAE